MHRVFLRISLISGKVNHRPNEAPLPNEFCESDLPVVVPDGLDQDGYASVFLVGRRMVMSAMCKVRHVPKGMCVRKGPVQA